MGSLMERTCFSYLNPCEPQSSTSNLSLGGWFDGKSTDMSDWFMDIMFISYIFNNIQPYEVKL